MARLVPFPAGGLSPEVSGGARPVESWARVGWRCGAVARQAAWAGGLAAEGGGDGVEGLGDLLGLVVGVPELLGDAVGEPVPLGLVLVALDDLGGVA
ncbi:hypothetical protein [Streptomyces sp. NPDC046197]|uniref:hypothetical protein n=1 Tax=Streptomyces sp. NPDC046197 TaxID=3154337 RepID=UPI0033F2D617